MKQFRWKILLCVLPVLAAAIVVGRAWTLYQEGRGGFNLGVDLAGGTILVYEVQDTEANIDINELAAALKRRIDPADLYNVTIRPAGTGRIEIILPTGSRRQVQAEEAEWKKVLAEAAEKWPPEKKSYDEIPRGNRIALIDRVKENAPGVSAEEVEKLITGDAEGGKERRGLSSEDVERIKELISRQGLLEFRILANDRDDAAAIKAAQDFFEKARKDPALQDELRRLALQGKPPPPPRNAQDTGTFPGSKDSTYTYTWVELGPDERASLNLDNQAEKDDKRNTTWKRVAEARQRGEPYLIVLPHPPEGFSNALIYSREHRSAALATPKDRDKKYEYFFLTRDPLPGKSVTGDLLDVNRVRSDIDDRLRPEVQFGFNSEGGQRFYELTSKNIPEGAEGSKFFRHLAVVMDNLIVSAPSLNSAIRSEGRISGIRSQEEVDKLVAILRSGRLPATLKARPVSENTIGATLGEDTIRSGAIAVVLAFLAVLVFMIIYYRFAGLVASTALLANLLLTVAFMVTVHATFTLPGLAGLVLMLGMAVDANVLIYERLREERDRGASLALALRNGYDRAFPTIIDTHLTSIFTAIVLYVVGNDQLKGFGISLTVGLLISLFTSLFMTRTYFDLALAQGWLTKLSMMRLLTRPNINFMGIRTYVFAFTVIVSLLGVTLFLVRGVKGLNIDFVGGTAYTAQLSEPETIQQLRSDLGKQAERLKVIEVRQPNANDPTAFEIVYDDGNGKQDVRLVHVDVSREQKGKPPTIDEVRERASELPDYSLEMIFLNDPAFGSGDRSRVFTVRTSEKAMELVQTAVSRLLGPALKRVAVVYEVAGVEQGPSRTALLSFTDAGNKEPAYASPARVSALLSKELVSDPDPAVRDLARELTVTGEGSEKEGLFAQMKVTAPRALSASKLDAILAALKKQYAENPQPERLENFDSHLARETQGRALWAIVASWGAILLYLWFRFGNWTFGLAAVLCLIHDLCFTLGVIAVCHYIDLYVPFLANILLLQDFKLDLAAVASLLTLVGYSVNDTIVVFDRIREVRGKNPALTPQMINDSANQTVSRTLLTSFTTWLVVIVLYIWGGAGVHLFAFVMVVGVIVGTFSSIYVASPLLLFFGEGRLPASRERPAQPAGTSA
jgi:SecD/SecF fusion protein